MLKPEQNVVHCKCLLFYYDNLIPIKDKTALCICIQTQDKMPVWIFSFVL